MTRVTFARWVRRPGRGTRPTLLTLAAIVVTILVALLAVGMTRSPSVKGNLIAGALPRCVEGVKNAKVLTDGVSAEEGGEWDSALAAIFESDSSFVEFDLGQSTEVKAAFLQGDNNDQYMLTISEDHATYVPLWTAMPKAEAGLRNRWSEKLSGRGRWVRLSVRGGDHAYSVSELELFSQPPPTMLPPMRREVGESQPAHVRTSLLYLVLAFGVFLLLTSARTKRWSFPIAALLPLAAAIVTLDAIHFAWPLAGREVSFVRASAATIALLAAIRRVVPGVRWPSHRGAITIALWSSALIAFATFYNLGRPQFLDHAHDRPEFVHTYDMRVYQPFAKYFAELQYDGVYAASVLAYAEDSQGGSLDRLGGMPIRGLRDHRVGLIRDASQDIRAIRTRFTAERWAELKRDMRYFEQVMGPEFLSTLTDHGANATPVWVFFARVLLAHAPASEGLLTFAGMVDGVLLLLMALALWWSFGLWPMLLAMTVFGATDLYMFGTNWAGATLRHDWLALLGFGASALKKERWTAAGICLALAGMIRAFPMVALIGVTLPALWGVVDLWRRERTLPSWRRLLEEHSGTVRVLVSAAASMIGMFLVTAFLYSFGSWENWWHKVTLLNSNVGVNEVSLRSLAFGADPSSSVLHARFAIYLAAQLGSVGCIVFLARRRPPHQGMLIAMPLVWVISNPSNYYSHFVFLFALLASVDDAPVRTGVEPFPGPGSSAAATIVPLSVPFLRVAFPLLALCVGGYWASLDPSEDRHFQDSTALLFLALGWLYANLLRAGRGLRTAAAESPVPM
jgi:hypothetical protein